MITEDYVSFEVASLLKDKGFSQKMKNSGYFATEMVYGITELEDGTHHLCHQYPACYDFDNHICAPTIQMAMKWLREVHDLHIMVNCVGKVNYDPIIQRFDVKDFEVDGVEVGTTKLIGGKYVNVRRGFKTYELACEAAIKYCLENLI